MPVDKYVPLDRPGLAVHVVYRHMRLRGRLHAWRLEDDRWIGYVEFSHPDGVTQPRWFDEDDITPA